MTALIPMTSPEQIQRAWDRLEEIFNSVARDLRAAGQILLQLEAWGQDTSHVRKGLWEAARRVAANELLPEVAEKYAHEEWRFKAISGMPFDEQRKFLDGETFDYYDPDSRRPVRVRLDLLSKPNFLRVVHEGKLRTIDEQRAECKTKPGSKVQKATIEYDPKTGFIESTRTKMPLLDVQSAVAKKMCALDEINYTDPERPPRRIVLEVTDVEFDRYTREAEQQGLTVSQLIRRKAAFAG